MSGVARKRKHGNSLVICGAHSTSAADSGRQQLAAVRQERSDVPGAIADIAGKSVKAETFRTLAWAYGFAHGGKTLFWTASDLYFTFYMTEVCAVSPAATGFVIGCSFLFAALADLTFARALAGATGKYAHPAQMQAIGAFASAAALLLFAGVAFAPTSMRLGASILALFGFRAAYALLDVPQNALLALAAGTEPERAKLTAVRNVTGATARTLLALAFVPVMTGHASTIAGIAFLSLVLLLSSLTIVSALVLARVAGQCRAAATTPDPAPGLASAVRLLLAMMFVQTIATTAFMQIEPYLAAYGIADRLSAGIFMGAIALGSAVSQPLWLRRSVTARSGMLLGQALGVMVIGSFLLVILPRDTLLGSGSAGLVYGIGSGGVLFALWTSVARNAARGSAVSVIGRFTAFAKLGQGIAVIGTGMLLDQWLQRTDGYRLAATMSGAILIGAILVGGLSAFGYRQRRHIVT